jgi:hypothetical protein
VTAARSQISITGDKPLNYRLEIIDIQQNPSIALKENRPCAFAAQNRARTLQTYGW